MLDIGWSELLVIGIVALVVIGPKELPGVLRTVGQMVAKLRRMAGEFQGQFQEALREAEMADLHKEITSLKDDAQKTISGVMPTNPLLDVKNDIENEVRAAKDAIEGRKDEPATKVDEAVAEASGLDPVSGELKKDASAEAVQAQLPIPEPPAPVEPYAFEDLIPATPAPVSSLRPAPAPVEVAKAPTVPVEVKPLDAKPVVATSVAPAVEAAASAPKPTRKPRIVTASEVTVSEAADAVPAKPKRAPRAKPAEAAAAEGAADAPAKPARKPRVKVAKPAGTPADDEAGA